MGEWGYIENVLEELQSQSSMLGHFWLLTMFMFRIVILGTVASELFEDEQDEFVCNTLQPGCEQVCYDKAFPISQYRFWVFQIVTISTPPVIFITYAVHHQSKRKKGSQTSVVELDSSLRNYHIASVFVRTLAEIAFLVGQFCLFGFKFESHFSCKKFPCPNTVDCFTSRPTEKTIFLCFYFALGVVSVALSCAEIIYDCAKKKKHKSNSTKYSHIMYKDPEEHLEMLQGGCSRISEQTGKTQRSNSDLYRSQTVLNGRNAHASRT